MQNSTLEKSILILLSIVTPLMLSAEVLEWGSSNRSTPPSIAVSQPSTPAALQNPSLPSSQNPFPTPTQTPGSSGAPLPYPNPMMPSQPGKQSIPGVAPQGLPGEQRPVLPLPGTESNGSLEVAVENFMEALRQMDASRAYYANTTQDFQKDTSLDTFKLYIRRNPVLLRNKSFTRESISFNGLVAVVKGKLISTDGDIARVEFNLIQENGLWKIRKIDLLKPQTR